MGRHNSFSPREHLTLLSPLLSYKVKERVQSPKPNLSNKTKLLPRTRYAVNLMIPKHSKTTEDANLSHHPGEMP